MAHAWAGVLPVLVSEPAGALLGRLLDFLPDATQEQERAWAQELAVLQREGAVVIELHPPAQEHTVVLEYQLPREAGRRPDVVVLQSGRVAVVEFKQSGRVRRADVDQTLGYARDLREYHAGSEGLDVCAVLCLCGAGVLDREVDGVRVVGPDRLARALVELAREGQGAPVEPGPWLASEYAPLPSLVQAARLLFERLELPFVRRAQSAGVHEATEVVLQHARDADERRCRKLVLVTGVPGAGKTLVGLQVVHHAALERGYRFTGRKTRGAPATFLSGNGPLVQVLQDALKSKAFVQDMHRYVREYGLERPDRVPPEHVIAFDEAQRAWSADKLEDFYSRKGVVPAEGPWCSEPELLVRVAERIPEWSVVIALVGHGQEIHTGEEGGHAQWAEAVSRWAGDAWEVVGPTFLQRHFLDRDLPYTVDDTLNLNRTLRTHAASDLHRWVELVLDHGELEQARPLADRLRILGFPIYVSRDLEACRGYARQRFGGEPDRRYGLLASSKARNLDAHGIDPGFQAIKRVQVHRWFNAPPDDARSACQLQDVVTEFQCQGLELDLPVVCWGDDYWWTDDGWTMRSTRKQRLVRDPETLRRNAYRVLLTRGREGLVVFVPPGPTAQMDATADALERAGAVRPSSLREDAAELLAAEPGVGWPA